MKRREFVKLVGGAIGCSTLSPLSVLAASKRQNLVAVKPLLPLPQDQTSHWLGKEFWGNRLQDWRMHKGALECLQGDKSFEMRTVSLLTRTLVQNHQPGRIQATFENITPKKSGYCGFLLGIGQGQLDYRGAALAQRAGGKYGGFMAVMNEQGELSFRDFSNQDQPLAFESLTTKKQPISQKVLSTPILLDCHFDPTTNNRFDIRLFAYHGETGKQLGFALRTGVNADELIGGISLISSPNTGESGAKWRIKDVATGGEKISVQPTHQLGPVMGCMHSVNQTSLKMTAQFMPVDLAHYSSATLSVKAPGSEQWQVMQTSDIEEGYVALFSINNWQSAKSLEYRISSNNQPNESLYTGIIKADPGTSKPLNIALYSCIIPTSKSLDDINFKKFIPQERILSRYGKDNILFPHNELVKNCDTHQPDLYVFCGDQYYETYPTRYGREGKYAQIDTLYRWYLWYWTFKESVRNTPAIVLADDHDVLQGNLWGAAGKNSEKPKEEDGGFKWDKKLVRMVYRIQHGHNPEPYDPTPIKFGIPVAYAEFIYGGVSFALVEDRKFKTPPNYKTPPTETRGELLGKRQEAFLANWAQTNTHLPKICLTASIWGGPQTTENFSALRDYDSNGYPPDGRTRAVNLVSTANALVLAGDQHLGMVTQQGIDDYDDGTVFFAGPAAAAFWQRWFEGNNQLEKQFKGNKNSGNFIDSFGNKMRVLAVANPKVSHQEFHDGNTSWGKFLADNRIKTEGYGIVKVDHHQKKYRLECWSWDTNPATGQQFEGWPIDVSFKGKLIP
ncbi:alkaline phosphatase D family protein [Thalassotalea sp. PLHSN55]|uniref:alkaline phosphatase D family protein n=1 Tax=Thalassotalea sp. PLHSN55 TaxID=3435888 RepID=UPI003F82E7E1